MNTDVNVLDLARARDLARSGTARAIRTSAGLSLREIAEAVGISTPTAYRWETGQRMPQGEPGIAWAQLMKQILQRGRS